MATWFDVFATLRRFVADPRPGTLRSGAVAADLRASGVDFPELDAIDEAVSADVAHRAPGTVAGHAGTARRWLEWSATWSTPLLASPVAVTLHLMVAAYIRARRNAPGVRPPPPATWPRVSLVARKSLVSPFVEVSSLGSEVGRFLGILNVLHIPHRPYGGPLPHSLLRVFGALDKHHRSVKSPLFVWQVLQVFRRLWLSEISLSADAASGFCQLALICIGILRPGFGTGLLADSVSIMPDDFRLPALLIEWLGVTKAKPSRLSAAQGGPPADSPQPVVTCVAHLLFQHTVIPFLLSSRHSERRGTPLFPRCKRAPDSALTSSHSRHLFAWGGSQLWEATDRPWSLEAITRFARDVLLRSGFPDALPFASGLHAGRLGAEMEGAELAFLDKVRDVVGQWAVLRRRMHEHYEAVALERMARYTASLGRLPMVRAGIGSVRLGIPASLDMETLAPHVRALGPVDPRLPVDSWIPAFVLAASRGLPPLPLPPAPLPPRLHEDIDSDLDEVEEGEAIWASYVSAPEAPADPDAGSLATFVSALEQLPYAAAAASAAALEPIPDE